MWPSAQPESERPAGIRPASAYSPELESLRGVAILLVFLFHTDAILREQLPAHTDVSPVHAFVTAGHTGVTLFFVLSAFLLSRPFLVEARGGVRVRRGHFFMRRVLRIMPLYAAAVVLAMILRAGEPGALTGGLGALFFLNGFTGFVKPLYPYSAVWWSLATEAQFYVLLPLVGLAIRSRAGRWLGSAALLTWAVAYLGIANGPWRPSSIAVQLNLMLSAFGRLPAFAVGIATAWLMLVHGERLRSACRRVAVLRASGGELVVAAALLALGVLLQSVTRINFFRAETFWPVWHVYESLLWGVVVLALLLFPLRIKPLLVNRFWIAVGVLSYSLYIVHYPLLYYGLRPLIRAGAVPSEGPGALATLLGALVACVGVSAVTYRVIERPFLVRKARID